MLDSKEPFFIQLVVASGLVSIEIVLDPTTIQNPVWSLTSVSAGTHYINVTSGDPNFHIGTNYFLNVYQTNKGSSSSAIKYLQTKKVQTLANGIAQKFMFDVTYKRVQFFAIQIPVSSSLSHKVQINITGLDNQSFYPGLYLNQYQSSSAVSDFTNLKFATVQDF
jgi:hypothetical protein